LHNAHSVLVAEPEVSIANLALAVSGQTMDLTRRLAATLPASGEALVRVGCDVHPWMRGWLVVLDHPYAAVTGADGRFAIAAVPAGSYTLALWHEMLGRAERPATVRRAPTSASTSRCPRDGRPSSPEANGCPAARGRATSSSAPCCHAAPREVTPCES